MDELPHGDAFFLTSLELWTRRPASWPDDKTFLGKPTDSATGLTHIGARAYDPGTGQFISVDPLLEIDKHQTLNGYSYTGQSPATNSDPTGTCLDPGNGRCQPGDNSGKPDPSFPINSSSPPEEDAGPGWNGTAPTGGTQSTGSGGGGGGGTTFVVGPNGMVCSNPGCVSLQKPDPVGESLLGLLRNAAYGAELLYTPFNLDCWGDNQEAGGCDLGAQYDAWAAEQGMDTQSDSYLVPGALAAMFGMGGAARRPGGKSGGAGLPKSYGVGWFPEGAAGKVPRVPGWTGPEMTRSMRASVKKGGAIKYGFVWRGPRQASIRVDRGDPNGADSQKVDHVVINSGGAIIGRDGKPLPQVQGGTLKSGHAAGHIPYSEWINWKKWDSPE